MLVNGSPKGFFKAQRGLRQRDPLSPFLFVIIGEALSKMISMAAEANLICGFRPTTSAPMVSHLQFADDTLIFCKAIVDQVRDVKAILLFFEAVSGLKVNFFKSELIRVRVEETHSLHLVDIMGCKVGTLPSVYLGLPLCGDLVPKVSWNSVVERDGKEVKGVES